MKRVSLWLATLAAGVLLGGCQVLENRLVFYPTHSRNRFLPGQPASQKHHPPGEPNRSISRQLMAPGYEPGGVHARVRRVPSFTVTAPLGI